jgi:phospholipid transport system substrate-binding protein
MHVSFEHNLARPRRRWLLAMAAVSALGPIRGQAQGTARVTDAQKPISELYAGLQTAMQMGSSHATFQQRFDRLAPVIDRVFNLNAILQTSVGLRWSSLDEASRRDLFAVFRTFTIASYTANFDSNGGEKFQVLPQTRPSGDDLIVESKLIPANGDPVRLDYVVHSGPTGQQIVDVLLNGSISRVAVQRSDFRALLASGSAAPLIASLKQKVSDLSGGAMRS